MAVAIVVRALLLATKNYEPDVRDSRYAGSAICSRTDWWPIHAEYPGSPGRKP
jgi:hypothetical protein